MPQFTIELPDSVTVKVRGRDVTFAMTEATAEAVREFTLRGITYVLNGAANGLDKADFANDAAYQDASEAAALQRWQDYIAGEFGRREAASRDPFEDALYFVVRKLTLTRVLTEAGVKRESDLSDAQIEALEARVEANVQKDAVRTNPEIAATVNLRMEEVEKRKARNKAQAASKSLAL